MSKRTIIISAAVLILAVLGFVFGVPAAKRKVQAVQCGNHVVSIGCATRLWAEDHDGRLPSDLLSMSNEIGTPKILVCPRDPSRQPAASWSVFTAADSSYEIAIPGLKKDDTNGVFLRCKIHGHLGYADATVFDGVRRRMKFP